MKNQYNKKAKAKKAKAFLTKKGYATIVEAKNLNSGKAIKWAKGIAHDHRRGYHHEGRVFVLSRRGPKIEDYTM